MESSKYIANELLPDFGPSAPVPEMVRKVSNVIDAWIQVALIILPCREIRHGVSRFGSQFQKPGRVAVEGYGKIGGAIEHFELIKHVVFARGCSRISNTPVNDVIELVRGR
ncbi:MAG: hypothetical protein GY696_33340 [Gammaproteobacteria bacterium]|nr:hypothetical protein [Gammaproteobacteria bacterium]